MYSPKNRYFNIISWLLLAVYLLNPFRVLQPLLNYQVNYQYISTVLCENIDKPELSCHGQCYLNKELAKTTEEQPAQVKSQTKGETDYLSNSKIIIKPCFKIASIQIVSEFTPDLLAGSHSITSPPPKG